MEFPWLFLFEKKEMKKKLRNKKKELKKQKEKNSKKVISLGGNERYL